MERGTTGTEQAHGVLEMSKPKALRELGRETAVSSSLGSVSCKRSASNARSVASASSSSTWRPCASPRLAAFLRCILILSARPSCPCVPGLTSQAPLLVRHAIPSLAAVVERPPQAVRLLSAARDALVWLAEPRPLPAGHREPPCDLRGQIKPSVAAVQAYWTCWSCGAQRSRCSCDQARTRRRVE